MRGVESKTIYHKWAPTSEIDKQVSDQWIVHPNHYDVDLKPRGDKKEQYTAIAPSLCCETYHVLARQRLSRSPPESLKRIPAKTAVKRQRTQN